ncbi:stalk domain-containing protein [Desulfothermobacter acidiphilus]|uniref:stalk domain-containing protein n=1 Tax=Desulfothermobacter acidiphilus TaxID=1938353 RepID=UPI003F8AF717
MLWCSGVRKRRWAEWGLFFFLLAFLLTPVSSWAEERRLELPTQVGKVLPDNWLLSPAGVQVKVGNLPTNAALTPDGRYLAVVNTGCSPKDQEISIIDLVKKQKVGSSLVPACFIGVAFSPDGKKLLVSGGNDNKLYLFAFNAGQLRLEGAIPVAGYPAGLTWLPDGRVAVAQNLLDQVALVDPSRKQVVGEIRVGRYPYWVTASLDGRAIYVSNWGADSVSVIDLQSQKEANRIAVGKLPEALLLSPDGRLLFVANTNSDNVMVIDTTSNRVLRTVDLHFQGLPSGAAPTGLALSPQGERLYVSLAGVNAVAVVDLASDRVMGYIPTAWYPTGVLYNPALQQLLVLNGKGMGVGPNPDGPKPGTNAPNQSQYIYDMITGTVSILAPPDARDLAQMTERVYSNALSGPAASASKAQGESKNPIPACVGGKSPIKHVFFIVRENRTYDQVLGDLPGANGDASLVLFGQPITPNAHALSRDFLTLDNFYADSEVSVQGHAWTTGAYSTDYVEKNTPLLYSGRYPHYDGGVVPITYPPNGYIWKHLEERHLPFKIYGENYYLHSGLYYVLCRVLGPDDPLTQNYYQFLRRADGRNVTGIMGRFYYRFKAYADHQTPDELERMLSQDPQLRNDLSEILTGGQELSRRMAQNPELMRAVAHYLSHYQFDYMGWDLKYPDTDRARVFMREFDREVASGQVPAFTYIWLPNDHTAGLKPGFLTPQELVAQNDLALGQIVEKISHSPVWRDSAIFVVEDDAQNGCDHVDAHRTVGLVISPYAKRGAVISTHYDQASMLRTMELILGLPPMSMYDAAALPMFDCFTSHPDFRPYRALGPAVRPYGEKWLCQFTLGEKGYWNWRELKQIPTDITPDLCQGRVYVPLRYLLEGLGMPADRINWNPSDGTVTVNSDRGLLRFAIGSPVIEVGGQQRDMGAAPFLAPPGRLEVPVRCLTETLGYQVHWEPESGGVVISDPAGHRVPLAGSYFKASPAALERLSGLSQRLDFSQADFPSEELDQLLNRILWESLKGTSY